MILMFGIEPPSSKEIKTIYQPLFISYRLQFDVRHSIGNNSSGDNNSKKKNKEEKKKEEEREEEEPAEEEE